MKLGTELLLALPNGAYVLRKKYATPVAATIPSVAAIHIVRFAKRSPTEFMLTPDHGLRLCEARSHAALSPAASASRARAMATLIAPIFPATIRRAFLQRLRRSSVSVGDVSGLLRSRPPPGPTRRSRPASHRHAPACSRPHPSKRRHRRERTIPRAPQRSAAELAISS